MGQAESADNDDQNCFRGCVKVKKEPNRKIEAKPQSRQNKLTHFQPKQLHQPCQAIPNICEPIAPKITANPSQSCETSLQLRYTSQQGTNRQKHLQQNSTNIVTVDIRDPPLLTAGFEQANQIVLGLQSKMSSHRQINFKSAGKIDKVKGSGMCEIGTPTTRCSSQQKESGSQTQTTTKTSRTTSTGKSRNILMNKIEQIKQKYYERQLEIEIYQDERDYQEQIDQIDQIQRTFTQQSLHVPQNSIREIKAIRQKILAKLREKKENKQKQNLGNLIVSQDNPLNLSIDRSMTIHDQLQIYSREGRNSFDENLMQSQKIKNSKRLKKSQSASAKMEIHGSLSRSLNRSNNDVSVDEKVQFSQYSEQTLHQIRELDEQYEDYRSKMTHKSNFKNNLNANPSQNQLSSHCSKRPPLSKFSRLNGRENEQKSIQPISTSKLKKPSRIVSEQNEAREGSEASQVQSYKVRQQSGVTHFSKGNKILLF